MGARFIAQYDSEFGCGCGQDIEVGDRIGYLEDGSLGCRDCVVKEDETNASWQWEQKA